MHAEYLVKGVAVGFYIAAPVGPTTVLVIHRTVRQSFKSGLLSGCGAACGDATYGLLAAFGVTFLASLVYGHEIIFKMVGGTFLLFWGMRIYGSRFAEQHPLVKGQGYGGPFLSTLILTLTNPMTVLAFMAILAGLGAADIHHHPLSVLEWLLGIGTGSLAWWSGLAKAADLLQEKLASPKTLTRINEVTGLLVIAAGILALLSLAPESERMKVMEHLQRRGYVERAPSYRRASMVSSRLFIESRGSSMRLFTPRRPCSDQAVLPS